MTQDSSNQEILPIKSGLVNAGGAASDEVQLLGSKCSQCHEVSIGTNAVCLNCGSEAIESLELSPQGTLWTYTIIRHKPPGEYLGPEPFEPYALGLVELPDGVRIMVPLEGDINHVKIGSTYHLTTWMLNAADGQTYRAFRFAPVKE